MYSSVPKVSAILKFPSLFHIKRLFFFKVIPLLHFWSDFNEVFTEKLQDEWVFFPLILKYIFQSQIFK